MNDALVIGGGLAGSAVAIHLARAGRSVVLLERERTAHHKVCGEFLSREAVSHLYSLGIDLPELGAVPIEAVRFNGVEAPLGFTAQSVSRYALDEALLQRAEASGAIVRRGPESNLPSASITFIATGKHDLPAYRRPPGVQSDLIGFKMYWQLSPEQRRSLNGAVELTAFPGGYAGLQNVENSWTNLCLVIRRSKLRELGANWATLLTHLRASGSTLSQRLSDANALWPKPLAIAPIPYGFRQQPDGSDSWRIGDQAAVIPSFAGNGMSIALRSAQLAAASYLSGQGSAHYLRRLNNEVRWPVRLATKVSQALVLESFASMAAGLVHYWPGMLPLLAEQTRIA